MMNDGNDNDNGSTVFAYLQNKIDESIAILVASMKRL